MKRPSAILFVLSAGVIAACSSTPPGDDSSHVQEALVSAANGGGFTVTEQQSSVLAGVAIEVPANALARDTLITVDHSGDLQLVEELEWAGPAADFGPDGLRFDQPVTIRLRTNVSFAEHDPVVWVVSEDGTTEVIGADAIALEDGAISFSGSHFTRFQPGRRPRDCYDRCLLAGGDPARCRVRCAGTSPAQRCRADADCPRGQLCNVNRNACYTPDPAPPQRCRVDADCPRGQLCHIDRNACYTPDPAPRSAAASTRTAPAASSATSTATPATRPIRPRRSAAASTRTAPAASSATRTATCAGNPLERARADGGARARGGGRRSRARVRPRKLAHHRPRFRLGSMNVRRAGQLHRHHG